MQRKFFMLAALLCSSYLQAQLNNTDSLQDVVVTATKFPLKTSQTGKVVTVITRKQIESSPGKDLAQLLTEQTGVYVNGAYSNTGKDKSIFLRGASSAYTVVLMDGVPVYDASGINSSFDLRLIALDQIERIEILKGSQGSLYGADAIAGVINIITRKGGKAAIDFTGNYSYGSFNTFRSSSAVHGNLQNVDYNIAFTQTETAGINETDVPGGDKDGFTQNNFSAGVGYQFNDNWKSQAYFRYQSLRNDLDNGAFSDDPDYTGKNLNTQAGVRNQFQFGKIQLQLNYNYNSINRKLLNDSLIKLSEFDGYFNAQYRSKEHFAEMLIQTPIAKHLNFTGGFDYRTAQSTENTNGVFKFLSGEDLFAIPYSSSISNDSSKQNQAAVFGSLHYLNKKLSIEAGGRFNRHSEYGNNAVFNFNPAYVLNKNFKLFANISSGYRVPSLYQLYSEYRNTVEILQPEESMSYEAGVQLNAASGKLNFSAVYFKRDIKNVIAFYFNPGTFQSFYINQDEQNDFGVETELSFQILPSLQVKAQYAYVDGTVQTVDAFGKDTSYFNLLRRPKHSYGLNINWQANARLIVSASLQGFGKRSDLDFFAFPSSEVELKAYQLINFYAAYSVSTGITVFADLRNIANTRFTEVLGYNTQGFAMNGGLRIKL